MERVVIEQNTPEWLVWRQLMRNASESPTVMGLEYTLAELAKRKRGIPLEDNEAMRMGREQEPLARHAYQEVFKVELEPVVVADGHYAASLDGITPDELHLVEIKTSTRGTHGSRWLLAEQGKMSDRDYCQVQHQLMVSKAKRATLWVWNPYTSLGLAVEARPDPDYWSLLRNRWDEVWPCLLERKDMAWDDAANAWRRARAALAAAEQSEKLAKQKLEDLAGTYEFQSGSGITLTRSTRAGAIDWKAAQQTMGDFDAEQFRKPPTVVTTIKESA